MKQVITNYSFSTSGLTVTLSDFGSSHPVDLKRLYIITDVTTNKILYNFADNTISSATISSNNVITLSALQGGESNSDSLQIIYEALSADPTYEIPLLSFNAAQEAGGNLAAIVSDLTNGTQQSKITDGTNVVSVLSPGTANTSGNALLSGGVSYPVTFSVTSVTATTSTDAGNYAYVSLQISSQGTSSTIAFQGSNDNSNWIAVSLLPISTNGGASTSSTSTGIYYGPLGYRYFRLNITGISAGTTAGTIIFQSIGRAQHSGNISAIQSGTWTVGSNSATGSAVPANAFYNAGIARSSLPTAATIGNLTGAMTDKFGRIVSLNNAPRDLVLPMTQLTLSASTTETTLITAVASTFLDLVSLVVINTSGTPTQVDFRDSTAGTIRLSLYVPGGDTRGIALPVPMPQNTVNNNWTAKCATSVSSIIITGTYITNQ
jgi:hypothetical protein